MRWLRWATALGACAMLALAVGAVGGGATAVAASGSSCPWLNTKLSVSDRVQLLVSHMTLAQKIAEMHVDTGATSGPYAGYEGYVPAQPSLCIPDLVEQDDSSGVGAGATGVTQLPAEVALGSAWDPALARQYGVINGIEHWDKGIAMALAPGINIDRDPRWGRNFEMFSEDPYLTSVLGTADTEGLQSQHVLADVKHLAVYNQETNRNTTSDDAIVDPRTLHEIYLPPFYAAAVTAHAASFMCSYAELNGPFSCQDPDLIDLLNDRWNYPGFVRSDGGANHSTVASANAGLDQERGSDYWDNGQLADAVNSGQVSEATIDEAVSRVFTEMFQDGLFDHAPTGTLSSPATSTAHADFARTVAERGTVLLRNADNALPLSSATTNSIAVIGPDGTTTPLTAGGGSSYVTPPHQISPLAGITSRAGSGVNVSSYSGTDPTQAAAAAKAAQVAIVFASQSESEGSDLSSISLPNGQDQLIEAVAAANPNTIVVLNTGGPVTMPWLSQVKSVVEAWYPGQEDGDALAAVLFGDVDPSGHLPETFPTSLSQVPTDTPAQWPGTAGKVQYSEGLDVGYRAYDAKGETPLFPFGYGLSYTTFGFSDLHVASTHVVNAVSGPDASAGQGATVATVTARVTNTGKVAGSDVAQLYLGDPAAAQEPPRQLEGFDRVTLAPGASTTVTFHLTGHDLSYFDTTADGWVLPDGSYDIRVGDSSALADLPLHGSLSVTRTVGARYAKLSAPASASPGSSFTATATYVNDGDEPIGGATESLQAPAGWAVTATDPAAAAIPAGGRATRTFRVTVPEGASAGPVHLHATLSSSGADGSGDERASAKLTVDPAVAVSTPATTVAALGGSVTAAVTLTSHLSSSVTLHLTPSSTGGVQVTPQSPQATLPAGGTATIKLTVSVASGQAPGTYPVALSPRFVDGGHTYTLAPAELHVLVPYASLSAAYDTTGISDDSDIAAANFDGFGNSYSEQALTAAGLAPGTTVSVDGGSAKWPDVAAGTPDSVLADGQAIAITGDASDTHLTFLGAASNANTSGTGTIQYTDGTVQTFTLAIDNWFYAPSDASDTTVATTPYINDSTGHGDGGVIGKRNQTVRVFGSTIALQAGKTVSSVTLPTVSNSLSGTAMHIFGIGLS